MVAVVGAVEQVGEGLLRFGEVGALDLPLCRHAQVFDLTANQTRGDDRDASGHCLDERQFGDLAVVDLRPCLSSHVPKEQESSANHEPGLLAFLAAHEWTQSRDRAFQTTLGAFD